MATWLHARLTHELLSSNCFNYWGVSTVLLSFQIQLQAAFWTSQSLSERQFDSRRCLIWRQMKSPTHIFCLLQLCWVRVLVFVFPIAKSVSYLRNACVHVHFVELHELRYKCDSIMTLCVAQGYSHATPLPIAGTKNGLLASCAWSPCRPL